MAKNGRQDYEGADVLVDADDQEVIVTDAGLMAPIVGELSANTTPADFERFRSIAAAWWARREKPAQHN